MSEAGNRKKEALIAGPDIFGLVCIRGKWINEFWTAVAFALKMVKSIQGKHLITLWTYYEKMLIDRKLLLVNIKFRPIIRFFSGLYYVGRVLRVVILKYFILRSHLSAD